MMTQNRLKIAFKKILYVILLCGFVSFFIVIKSYAVATPSDLNSELDITELEEISDFTDLKEMVGQIFDINTNMGTDDLQDPIKLMSSLLNRIIVYWNDSFTTSTLYHLLVGLAFIFLVANFIIKMYEEMSAGLELKIDSELMVKKYIQFIFAILMIFYLRNIVYFILGFFRFVVNLCINVSENNFLGGVENIDVVNPERVAYEILKENGIIKSNTLLDEVVARSKESKVLTQYMVPWIFSWISKLALLVIIFINSIKLFVYSSFYIVAVGDFMGDIKRSKFIEYTKVLIAVIFEEAVIVIILYLSNLLLNPYLKDLLTDGVKSGGLSYIALAMIFTGVSMSKVFVIISSSMIAKRIIGVA